MKIISIWLLLVLILYSCTCRIKSEKGWVQLFNGKNLDGWDIKFAGYPLNENYKNTFRVEDGILKVRYDEYDSLGNVFGHLITKRSFSHYKIRAEYRFVGNQIKGGADWAYRNNGIMVHCQSAGSMTLDQDFPVSIEVQLLGGMGNDDRTNMNVCTPGTLIDINGKEYTGHCFNSRSKVKNGEQWTKVEVEVYGDSIIRHIVDGQVVLEYTHPRLDPLSPFYQKLVSSETGARLTKGRIAVQAESHPTDFRKIELLDLTDVCNTDSK
jgi:hypothetical protein